MFFDIHLIINSNSVYKYSELINIKNYFTTLYLKYMKKKSLGQIIKELKTEKKVSFAVMSRDLQVSTQTIQAWFNDKVEPTPRHMNKLSEYFNVHPSYFFGSDDISITGELQGQTIIKTAKNTLIDIGGNRFIMQIPIVEQFAYGGYLTGYADQKFMEDLPIHPFVVDKAHFGSYRAFRVRGSSMDDGTYNSIRSGNLIVGREVKKEYWSSKLHINDWPNWIIVHQEGIIVKRISNHNIEEGSIVCSSLNPDKAMYPDRKILLEDCYQIYNVVFHGIN